MPFYRITITDIYGHISQGVREDYLTDIDTFYEKTKRKAITAMKAKFKSIDVVMIVSNSNEAIAYQALNR